MKKCIIICLVFCFLFNITAFGKETDLKYSKTFYEKLISMECEYIRSLVLPGGAIGFDVPDAVNVDPSSLPTVDGVKPEEYTTWNHTKIVPYFSAFAVLGYMEADGEDAEKIAKDYIDWYVAHMNKKDVNGVPDTVYDYQVFVSPEGKVVEISYPEFYGDNKQNYDSTDSYASTFLQILCKYTEKYDKDFLKNNVSLVERLVAVIYSTYCENLGLTGAKPDYMVCYLMDNCEVYAAFEDLSAHFEKYAKDAESFRKAIIKNFEKDGYYLAALFENGKDAYNTGSPESFEYYPQGTCQLFPVIFGVIDGDKAQAQYDLFNSLFSKGTVGKEWTLVSCGDNYPWSLNLRAAVKSGDTVRAEKFIQTVYTKYITTGHTSYYYCAEAGHMLLGITEMLSESDETSGAPSQETSQAPSKDTSQDISQTPSQDISQTPSQDISQTPSQNISEIPSQETSGDTSLVPDNDSENSNTSSSTQNGGFTKYLPFVIGGAVLAGVAVAAVLILKKRK